MERLRVLKIVCLLCLFVPRVSVAQIFTHSSSPYRAQAPVATMRSTSSMRGNTVGYSGAGVSRATYGTVGSMRTGGSYSARTSSSTAVYRPGANVQGFYTAASTVYGGVTTGQKHAASRTPRRLGGIMPPPPDPEEEGMGCEHCHPDENGICVNCGCDVYGPDGCTCDTDPYGPGYCWCPIGDGWDVWIMLAVLAIVYAFFIRKRSVKSEA